MRQERSRPTLAEDALDSVNERLLGTDDDEVDLAERTGSARKRLDEDGGACTDLVLQSEVQQALEVLPRDGHRDRLLARRSSPVACAAFVRKISISSRKSAWRADPARRNAPGATKIFSTRGLWLSFHARACSRPPPPTRSTRSFCERGSAMRGERRRRGQEAGTAHLWLKERVGLSHSVHSRARLSVKGRRRGGLTPLSSLVDEVDSRPCARLQQYRSDRHAAALGGCQASLGPERARPHHRQSLPLSAPVALRPARPSAYRGSCRRRGAGRRRRQASCSFCTKLNPIIDPPSSPSPGRPRSRVFCRAC